MKKLATQHRQRLTVEAADELINCNATHEDGAIEDAEVEHDQVRYFFESGAAGTVDRRTAEVTITRPESEKEQAAVELGSLLDVLRTIDNDQQTEQEAK